LYLDLYVREYLAYNADIYSCQIPYWGSTTNDWFNYSHKKIGQLSKGYRQRVGLANALPTIQMF
jgi:ABC-2 type transport system ATP-binding protein